MGCLCQAVLFASLLLGPAVGQFVVETNSMRVREPAAISGEFDVAIGDVSPCFAAQVHVNHVSSEFGSLTGKRGVMLEALLMSTVWSPAVWCHSTWGGGLHE